MKHVKRLLKNMAKIISMQNACLFKAGHKDSMKFEGNIKGMITDNRLLCMIFIEI